MGAIVLVRGALRGMEREAHCEVIARKHTVENGSRYLEGFVLNAPGDPPDGEYAVAFDGHSLRAVRHLGIWLTSTDMVCIVLPERDGRLAAD